LKTQETSEPRSSKKRNKPHSFSSKKINYKWIFTIFFSTILITIVFSFLSSEVLNNAGYVLAFAVLAIFILIGVLFDVVGVAVTAADEKPFHSMAARKVPGAIEALRLLRSADKVSNFCNDVVGDICGIISGTTSAIIVSRLSRSFTINELVTQLVISGIVAGATVGGKALGKFFALQESTNIVHLASRIIYLFKSIKKNVLELTKRKV